MQFISLFLSLSLKNIFNVKTRPHDLAVDHSDRNHSLHHEGFYTCILFNKVQQIYAQ